MAPASRSSLTHRLELGADRAERHFRICHGDAGGHHHQAILGRPTRRPFQQFRVGEPLADCSSNGAPQALDGPARPAGLIQDADNVLPGVLWPHASHRRQPSVHGRDDIASEDAISRRCGLGDGGRVPCPEAGISWKLSAGPRRLDARLRALGNQRPFELRDRAKDLERKHALGRRSVDGCRFPSRFDPGFASRTDPA